MTLNVPIKLVSEANSHAHFRERQKRAAEQHRAVGYLLNGRRPPALPCVVVITRIAPRELDTDNLQGSAKHVRDAVAKWLGVDDRDPRVTWHVAQAPSLVPKHYSARITVRGRTEADDLYDRARERVLTEAPARGAA